MFKLVSCPLFAGLLVDWLMICRLLVVLEKWTHPGEQQGPGWVMSWKQSWKRRDRNNHLVVFINLLFKYIINVGFAFNLV